MTLEQLKSAIYNNVMSGLRGASINSPFTLEQIEDGIIQERLTIIKEYSLKNLVPVKDLTYSIRCVEVDCESLDRCPCDKEQTETMRHIEIPQVFNDFGEESVDYIGSTDGLISYTVYTTDAFRNHKYRRRGARDPYIWVDTTPNANGFNDAFIFNASPLLKELLVRMIPKDPRQLLDYSCCSAEDIQNINFIDGEIEKRLTEKYLRWYRQTAVPLSPNDQTIKT